MSQHSPFLSASAPSASSSNLNLTEIEGWAATLAQLHARIASRFERAEPRQQALLYLRGLLSPLERKTSWQLAELTGQLTPYRLQRLLSRAKWEADAVRDDLQKYVAEHLASSQAVVVLDETGFLKKGLKSVGVKRQYSGTAGRVENCQIGVFLAYASPKGHTLIDRELYLPQEWAEDLARREAAQVPDTIEFATKPTLARQMLVRLLASGLPFQWVSGDEVYGSDRKLRLWLEEHRLPYVVVVASNEAIWHQGEAAAEPLQIEAKLLISEQACSQWQCLSCGEGAKGPRLYEWVEVKLPRPRAASSQFEYWLVARRSIAKPQELAYYLAFAPAGTTLQTLVGVIGQRWRVEESFELSKGEVGLDHYEVRHWQGWYRHITLAMLALAYLTVVRYQANQALVVEEKSDPLRQREEEPSKKEAKALGSL